MHIGRNKKKGDKEKGKYRYGEMENSVRWAKKIKRKFQYYSYISLCYLNKQRWNLIKYCFILNIFYGSMFSTVSLWSIFHMVFFSFTYKKQTMKTCVGYQRLFFVSNWNHFIFTWLKHKLLFKGASNSWILKQNKLKIRIEIFFQSSPLLGAYYIDNWYILADVQPIVGMNNMQRDFSKIHLPLDIFTSKRPYI